MLTFLRDGKIHLPTTVAKAGILTELEYYGIDGNNADFIHEVTNVHTLHMMEDFVNDLEQKKSQHLIQHGIMEIAVYCLRSYSAGRLQSDKPYCWAFVSNVARWHLSKKDGKCPVWKSIYGAFNRTNCTTRVDEVNKILNKVSLHLKSMTYDTCYVFDFVVEVLDK